MISQALESNFDNATEAVNEGFRELEKLGGKSPSEVLNITYTQLLLSFTPGVTRRFTKEGGVFYEVEEFASIYLGGAAQNLPKAFDVLQAICASNVAEAAAMPKSLRLKAHQLILGKFPGAIRRVARIAVDFTKKFVMRQTALSVRDAFELNLTRHDGPKTMSACDAVSMVADSFGVMVSYKNFESWCTHASYNGFRERADALWHHLVDRYLVSLGALSNSPTAMSGPLIELGRIRKS